MPTKIELQWHAATRRWRKKIMGKDYYFTTPSGLKSDMDGYRAAYAQYEILRDRLQAHEAKPVTIRGRAAVARHLDKAKFYELTGAPAKARDERVAAMTTEQAVDAGTWAELSPTERDIAQRLFGVHPEQKWDERLAAVQKIYDPSKGKTLSVIVADFLAIKKNQAKGGSVSAGRYGYLKLALETCVTLLDDPALVAVDEMTLTTLHSELVAKTEWGAVYKKNIFDCFRQLIRWAWANRYMNDLPRNMKSKEWVFGSVGKKVKKAERFEVAEIKTILDALSAEYKGRGSNKTHGKCRQRMRCFLLLALNTGFTQADISDLDASEVDWENGTITRKRSKTDNHAGVPEITWKLWPETFALVKKFGHRSGLVFRTNAGTAFNGSKVKDDGAGFYRKDVIGREWRRIMKSKFPTNKELQGKSFKTARKTGNSVLIGSPYSDMGCYYLCHSPRGMNQKHYDVHSPEFQTRFDEAVAYIGKKLGVA